MGFKTAINLNSITVSSRVNAAYITSAMPPEDKLQPICYL